jgi:hypothetical protein
MASGPYANRDIPVEELTPRRLRNFWRKVAISDGCWHWTGGTTGHRTHPYGHTRIGAAMYVAHRVSYFLHTWDQIPAGSVIDHTCRVTTCVNPAHMNIVTQAENIRRGTRHTGAAA